MSMVRSRRLAAALLLAAAMVAPRTADAQAPTSTGANVEDGRDARWQVAYRQGDGSFGSFFDVFVHLEPIPPVWEPNTLLWRWVTATPSGSLGGGATDYIYRILFQAAGGASSLTFRCVVDNSFTGFRLNGGSLGTGCGSQSSGFQFGDPITINSGFVAGTNVLEFHVSGDAQTDGLLVDVQSFRSSAVPEPATMTLIATGLVGLGGFARRRARAQRD